MIRRLGLLIAAILLCGPAQASVSMDFYSREMGNYFPHAFIVLSGHTDDDPRPVNASYGFTAASVSPAILMGRVKGVVDPVPASYIAGSTRHFTVQITDAQYARVRALIAQWQALPQPSYDLHKRNCVSFAAALAREIGLRAEEDARLVTKPNAYLTKIRLANPVLGDGRSPILAQRIAEANAPGARPITVDTPPPPPAQRASVSPDPATRETLNPALSAAAIAAGYRPPPRDR